MDLESSIRHLVTSAATLEWAVHLLSQMSPGAVRLQAPFEIKKICIGTYLSTFAIFYAERL